VNNWKSKTNFQNSVLKKKSLGGTKWQNSFIDLSVYTTKIFFYVRYSLSCTKKSKKNPTEPTFSKKAKIFQKSQNLPKKAKTFQKKQKLPKKPKFVNRT
jgi:hypothetical protein